VTSDLWHWWRTALANPASIGAELIVTEQDIQAGYFRAKLKNGAWLPVVFWFSENDGSLKCLHGRVAVTKLDHMTDLWLRCCRNPISTAQYKHWEADGSWADVDAAVAEQLRSSNAADVEPEVLLADQIASALAGVSDYATVDSDERAAAAQSLRARLLELSGQADRVRVKEKQPFKHAADQVDARYMPLVKDAKGGADQIRAAVSAYETRKLAELRRQEAERRAAEAPPVEPEPIAAQVKGGYGKAAHVHRKRVVDEVVDWAALFMAYVDREDVRSLLLRLANADLAKGVAVPGVTTKEVADVR
jgi:hypothetical protein